MESTMITPMPGLVSWRGLSLATAGLFVPGMLRIADGGSEPSRSTIGLQ
jgi:hypothetical protein